MQFFQGRLAIKTLKSKLFIWSSLPALVLGSLVAVYFLSIKDFSVFPNSHAFDYRFYSDSAIGGNSRFFNYTVTDSIIKADFIISNKIGAPYIGLSIAPKTALSLNVNKYNQLTIKVKGYKLNGIGIALFASNQSTKIATKSSELLFYHTFEISSETETYKLIMDKFKIPDWWGEINRIDEAATIRPDLKALQAINISNSYTSNKEQKLSLEIYSISFSRNNTSIITFIATFLFLLIPGAFTIIYLSEIIRNNNKTVTITYKPIEKETTTTPQATFIHFINQNFDNSQLTIEIVSEETNTSQRKITNYIQSQFACNFKAYVNRLRINESKRLLIETELNVGEIAFKVGFNNQSHFNRVFRTEMNISPTEFRERKERTK